MGEQRSPFHRGEIELQSRLGIRDKMEGLGRRVIRDHLLENHRELLSSLSLLAVGTIDASGRPWASVLVGKPGFVRAKDSRRIEVRARPIYGDPLNKALVEGADVGTLAIDFESRRRNRANGTIASRTESTFELEVKQSFGNCPKYIQSRQLMLDDRIETIGRSRSVRHADSLSRADAALVARADTLFIASRFAEEREDDRHGLDVSHRGGMPGFVVVAHESLLLFPDYAGNCLFNTLGNLQVDPRCGLLFLDFDTGDTLQLCGEARVLWEPHHVCRFPGAKRVVSFQIDGALRIEGALPMRWQLLGYSPVFENLEASDPAEPSPAPPTPTPMRVRSVNVSMPREVSHVDKTVETGIFKKPVEGRVVLRRLNLEGDGQADLWGHGGAFRAVYAYTFENYAYWARELGRDDLAAAQFGENLTVEGMLDDEICVGDVFRIGDALVEVSQPRIPCYKLAIKIGIDGFQNAFLKSGRVGFYFRVLEEGEIGAGDVIERVRQDSRGMSVTAVSNLLYFDKDNLPATERALQIPALAHGWKGSFEDRLAKAKRSPPTWTGFRDFVVSRREKESEAITSFYLLPEDGAPLPRFLPGQFLTFKLDFPDQKEPLIRTYSLSDGPNPGGYRVSIKREPPPADRPELPGGLSSNYFHDQVEVGTVLRVGTPRGKFHIDLDSDRAVVLISSGVGLTPMISMMNAIVEGESQRPVWFIHGARNGRQHAMGEHVRRIADENENVHAHIRYSQPLPDDVAGRDYDSRGRVDVDLLKKVLPFDSFDFYLCGPVAFMRSLYCGLLSLGVSETRIHYEFFGPGSILQDDAEPGPGDGAPTTEAELVGGIQVSFARSGVTASWDPACETILDLAEREGMNPDYSCRAGICHTCACKLTEGEVEYLEEPLDPPDSGTVLICCSRPRTSLVLEI